jgi:hypothetical protein
MVWCGEVWITKAGLNERGMIMRALKAVSGECADLTMEVYLVDVLFMPQPNSGQSRLGCYSTLDRACEVAEEYAKGRTANGQTMWEKRSHPRDNDGIPYWVVLRLDGWVWEEVAITVLRVEE